MSRMTELAQWIKAHDDFAVISHVHPDGDTLGSTAAITIALKALGKNAFAYCKDEVPHMYRFMPQTELFCKPDSIPYEPRSLFYVDVSAKDRAGEVLSLTQNATAGALIDHHGTNPLFAQDVNFVDARASATGELAYELIPELGVELTKEIAESLYMAIVCDTNNFSIPTVTGETFRIAGVLTDAGVDVQEMCRRLIKLRSVSRTRLLGKVLNNIEFAGNGKIAYAAVSRSLFREAEADDEDTEGIVNILNDTENVEIAILATELKDGNSKFSLRAAGDCNVSDIAVKFQGGGHAKAAGVTLNMSLGEAMSIILKEAEKLV